MENEQYLLDDLQNVQEPVWATDADIEDMRLVEDTNNTYPGNGQLPNVRVHGGLDFMEDVREAVEGIVGESELPYKPAKIDAIPIKPTGSEKWRARTVTVKPQMSNPIIVNSPQRRRVTLVNYGPAIVYISSQGNSGPAAANTVRLPVVTATLWPPFTLETKDDVWAVTAAGGADTTVEVVEEFDME
jgi:hypothetical protein